MRVIEVMEVKGLVFTAININLNGHLTMIVLNLIITLLYDVLELNKRLQLGQLRGFPI